MFFYFILFSGLGIKSHARGYEILVRWNDLWRVLVITRPVFDLTIWRVEWAWFLLSSILRWQSDWKLEGRAGMVGMVGGWK